MTPKNTTDSSSAQIWQEAYKAIIDDPKEYQVYQNFTDAIPGMPSDLNNAKGRKWLKFAVENASKKVQSSSSPTTQSTFAQLQKFRGLIASGASVNPIATIVVGGVFIGLDMLMMHHAEQGNISEILSKMTTIAYDTELLYDYSQSRPGESPLLVDVREELRAAFVQLQRTTLLLSMKIVYKLRRRRQKYLHAFSLWGEELKTLQGHESRVKGHIDAIFKHLLLAPQPGPSWSQKDEQIPQLHRWARDGRADQV